MMKKYLFIAFIVSSTLFAQNEETKPKNWIVKWNNTAAVDVFSFPTLQFAVERRVNDYFSIQTELGVQVYNNNKHFDTLSVKTSGIRAITEGRFYFINYFTRNKSDYKTTKTKPYGAYTGLQFFYRKNSYNHKEHYYLNESDYDTSTNEQIDEFGVKKEVYGVSLCFGYQIQLNNFILEPYTYIGVLNRNIKNFNREFNDNLGHIPEDNIHFFGKDLEEESGNGDANVSIGFRIGYRF